MSNTPKIERYRIEYKDPETQEVKTHEGIYQDTADASAMDWAVDHAYSLSNKGWFQVEKIGDE